MKLSERDAMVVGMEGVHTAVAAAATGPAVAEGTAEGTVGICLGWEAVLGRDWIASGGRSVGRAAARRRCCCRG